MTNGRFAIAFLLGISILVMAVFVTACRTPEGSATTAMGSGFLDVEVPPHPQATSTTLAHGKELYDVNCAHCHGEKGDGAGYGAPFLVPAPRDFVQAQYKFPHNLIRPAAHR
jgi:mono/diheme cytochrome c family protein